MPNFGFRGRFTVDDFKDFYRFHADNAPIGKKLVLLWRLMALIVPFLIFMLMGDGLFYMFENPIYLGACASLMIIFFLLAKKNCVWLTFLSIKQLKKRPVNPLENDVNVGYFDDYYLDTCSHLETKYDYALMDKIYKTKNAYYIALKNQNYYLMYPYRFFANEEEQKNFFEFITQKINQKS